MSVTMRQWNPFSHLRYYNQRGRVQCSDPRTLKDWRIDLGRVRECCILNTTGLFGELEHLQIKTRLIDEMFAIVIGEYVFLK